MPRGWLRLFPFFRYPDGWDGTVDPTKSVPGFAAITVNFRQSTVFDCIQSTLEKSHPEAFQSP